jgi:hypothetical protein
VDALCRLILFGPDAGTHRAPRRPSETMPSRAHRVMTVAFDVLVPLASVLLGATITYLLNVRTRRRSHVEDRFNDAIAAVSLVISTHSYVPGYGKWHPAVTEDERVELEKEMAREATINHIRAIGVARDAVAQCLPYNPRLRQLLDQPVLYFQDHADEIIAALRRAPDRSASSSPLPRLFGALPDWLPPAIGEVVIVAGLLESRIDALVMSLSEEAQGAHPGKNMGDAIKLSRKRLRELQTVDPGLAESVDQLLTDIESALARRNEAVHAIWRPGTPTVVKMARHLPRNRRKKDPESGEERWLDWREINQGQLCELATELAELILRLRGAISATAARVAMVRQVTHPNL